MTTTTSQDSTKLPCSVFHSLFLPVFYLFFRRRERNGTIIPYSSPCHHCFFFPHLTLSRDSLIHTRTYLYTNINSTRARLKNFDHTFPKKMDEPSNSIYDESSFPANAESESDTEKVVGSLETNKIKSRAPLGGDRGVAEAALSDDIMCVVCAEILVEPCSLHCGHSFCQLCLASLWKSCQNKSPLYLKCPVCRQPWVNFPGVNIQLRYE